MSEHHATLPPSAFPAILECPCYQSGPGGEAAEKGTKQHDYLEQLLTSPQRDKCLGIDSDELDGIHWAYDYILAHASGGPEKLAVEKRVHLIDEETFEEITFGRVDAFSAPDLFDFKSGESRNYRPQMAAYALGKMQETGLEKIRVHELYGKSKYAHVYTVEKAAALETVREVVRRRRDPNREPAPCDYCGWCKLALTCPALNERAREVGKNREDWKLTQYHSSEIKDPAEMSKALLLARELRPWCEAVEYSAKEMTIKQGLKLPGFTMTQKAGAREIENIGIAFQKSGLPQDKFLECCKVLIGKLEDALVAFTGLKKIQAAKQLNEKLEECIVRRAPVFMLVREKTKE